MNTKADKIAALDQLENNTHVFWLVDAALRLSRPFGFDVIVRIAKANPTDPKGLTLADGATEAQGAGSREIAEAICKHLGLQYPPMMGRGFAVRACCEVVRQHIAGDQ